MVRGKVSLALALGLVLLAAGVQESGAAGPLVFEDGFESGVIADAAWNVSGNKPVVQGQITRSGKHAIKSVLNRLTSGDSNRTELRAKAPPPTWFTDTWYGFSIYLPSPYPADEYNEILAQWHGNWDKELGESSQGGPPLAIKLNAGSWHVVRQWDPAQITTSKTGKSSTHTIGSYNGDLDKWTDWVLRVHWDYRTNGNGRVTVWKNGKQVLDINAPVGYNDLVGPYFKWGIYKGPWANYASDFGNERIAYHDEFRMAIGPTASYDDVAPGPKAVGPNPPASLVSD